MQVLREIDINPTIIKNVPSALKESYGSIRLIRPPTLFFPQCSVMLLGEIIQNICVLYSKGKNSFSLCMYMLGHKVKYISFCGTQ